MTTTETNTEHDRTEQAADAQGTAEQPHDGAQRHNENAPDHDNEAQDEHRSANAEAAKYRRQLRDTEAELDRLRGELDAMRYQQVDHYLTVGPVRLHAPKDIWRYGVELSDVLAPDGAVDDQLVQEAAQRIAREHPHLAKPPMGSRDAAAGAPAFPSGPSWRDVIQGT